VSEKFSQHDPSKITDESKEILTITSKKLLKDKEKEKKSEKGSAHTLDHASALTSSLVFKVGKILLNENDNENKFLTELKIKVSKITLTYFINHFLECDKRFAFFIFKKNANNESDGLLKTTKISTDLSKLMLEYPSKVFNEYYFSEENQKTYFSNEEKFQQYIAKFKDIPMESVIFLESKINLDLIMAARQLEIDLKAYINFFTEKRKIGLIALSYDEKLIYNPDNDQEKQIGNTYKISLLAGLNYTKKISIDLNIDIMVINIGKEFYGLDAKDFKYDQISIHKLEKEKAENERKIAEEKLIEEKENERKIAEEKLIEEKEKAENERKIAEEKLEIQTKFTKDLIEKIKELKNKDLDALLNEFTNPLEKP